MTNSITKGRIVTQDMGVYDGVHSTVGRRDSSGGTVSGLAIGAVVDVLAAYGNHEDYSQAAIGRAVNAIGSKNRTLVFRPGTWKITTNLTIASNFSIYMPAGAVFDVAAGVTLTISGAFFNDHATYSSGSGTVSLATKSFSGSVDIADHDTATVGLKLGGTLITTSAAELNKLDGLTSKASELNRLAGTVTQAREALGIYIGFIITGAGGSSVLPSGWSVANPATGTYRVTHNLGIATVNSDLMIIPASFSNLIISVSAPLANQFDLDLVDDTGAAANASAYFIAVLANPEA